MALTLVRAGAAQPPSRYPLDLNVAIAKAYAGKLTGIERSCTVWFNGGRDEYVLVAVTVDGGRKDVAGFQCRDTGEPRFVLAWAGG